MLTPWLNNETRNVIGLIAPCHRPSQKPAMCAASTCATLFGPAAQPPRTTAITTSTATCVALHLVTAITSTSSECALAKRGQTQRSPVAGTTCRPGERSHASSRPRTGVPGAGRSASRWSSERGSASANVAGPGPGGHVSSFQRGCDHNARLGCPARAGARGCGAGATRTPLTSSHSVSSPLRSLRGATANGGMAAAACGARKRVTRSAR